MALNLTCLNVTVPLPIIPIGNNLTISPTHSNYDPYGKAISQLISSSLARSTFSTADIESILNTLTSDDTNSLNLPALTSMKPIKSTIIYGSVTLFLFLILSLVFYCISCTNCCQAKSIQDYSRSKQRKCSRQCVSVVVILLIGLIVLGQMIYIAYHVNRTTTFLDNSIQEFNQEIYPKEIGLYLEHLLQQLKMLDAYSMPSSTIIIDASRSMFLKSFNKILKEQYFLNIIQQTISSNDMHIDELNTLIGQESTSSPIATSIVDEITKQHEEMADQLAVPLAELCAFVDGKDTDIDAIILDSLSLVHEQITKITNIIEIDFLNYMKPWEDHVLLNQELEKQIRYYTRLAGTILLVLIIIFGLFPVGLFTVIILYHCRQRHLVSKYRSRDDDRQSSTRRSQSSIVHSDFSSESSTNGTICWLRIIFIPVIIILVMIILLSSLFYAVDLFAQGACRTAHEDDTFLIPFLIDELLGSNSSDVMIPGLDIQTTFLKIVDDCRHETHFSRHFFASHLRRLHEDVNKSMNQLNDKIGQQFYVSIAAINIQDDISLLNNLSSLFSSDSIRNKIEQIREGFKNLQQQFENITAATPTIPLDIVNQTIDNFEVYVREMIESTIDTCPLPLATIYKTDIFVCHEFAATINGLWFSLFLYMLFLILGLAIGGLCVYKQLRVTANTESRNIDLMRSQF
ncbi:unnamed protein product [Adineta ricciae]|uniref:Prominin-like protein n=1 Tax=Adineta ricciae TaxID=249248 RepID=A0A814RVL6_ADIRI|nr:unnamed protein product [Adineta ricciae]